MSDKTNAEPMRLYTVVMVNRQTPHEVKVAKIKTTHGEHAVYYAYKEVGPLKGEWTTVTLDEHGEHAYDSAWRVM